MISKAVLLIGLLLTVAVQASAENESNKNVRLGTIKGRVTDVDTKTPIVGATVQVLDTDRGAFTDTSGVYEIKNVPVGSYQVKYTCVGFEPITRTDVIVRSKRLSIVDVELSITAVEINSIKVTAGYFHEIQDQPTSSTNFTGEEIRRAPGSAGDVSRIVAVLPSIAKVNDMVNSLVVRGGSPTENAFYVDNIEIPNINHYPIQGTSGGPISLLNVDFIKNVNFSAGGFSAAYGDRLSSVMEIDFREGNRYEHDVQLDMNFAGFGLVAEGPLNKGKGSFLFSGRRSYLDLLVDAIGTGVAPRYSDYQGKVVYDLSNTHQLSFLGIYGHDNIEFEKQSSIDDDIPFYGPFSGHEYAFGVNWRWLWHKNGYSNTAISYLGTKYNQDVYETFMPDSLDPWVFTQETLEELYQIRNVNHYRFSETFSTEFGFDIKYTHNNYYERSAPYTNAIGNPIPAIFVDKVLESPRYGAYGSFTLRPVDRLTADLGLRYDYFPFNDNSHLAPRLSLSYDVTERLKLKAAAGVYYQSIPLALVAQKKEFESLDDPVAYHYIGGFDYLLTDETKLTLEAYYKRYKNFPMDPAQPMLFLADELSYQRIVGIFEELVSNGVAESYGVEGTIQKKLAKDFYGLISGSYFRAKYEGLDGVWRPRIFDNRYLFSVEGGYKPNNKWEYSVRWILAGGPPYSPIDPVASEAVGRTVYDAGRANDARYPAYHSLNIRVERRFHFKSSNLIAYLSIWNAYNRENVSMYYWNVPDRKIDKMFQWSLLPVGGFEFEF